MGARSAAWDTPDAASTTAITHTNRDVQVVIQSTSLSVCFPMAPIFPFAKRARPGVASFWLDFIGRPKALEVLESIP